MAARTATADGTGDMEHSGSGQGMWRLDELSNTMDHTRRGNDYDIPASIADTAFAEDFIVQDEEPVYANIQK